MLKIERLIIGRQGAGIVEGEIGGIASLFLFESRRLAWGYEPV